MSLVPSEREVLARIEDSLRSSDPRLATMLTTFSLPGYGGTVLIWMRRCLQQLRYKRLVLVTIAVVAVTLAMIGLLPHAGSSRSPCAPGGRQLIVAGQVRSCPPAGDGAPSALHHPTGYGKARVVPVSGGRAGP